MCSEYWLSWRWTLDAENVAKLGERFVRAVLHAVDIALSKWVEVCKYCGLHLRCTSIKHKKIIIFGLKGCRSICFEVFEFSMCFPNRNPFNFVYRSTHGAVRHFSRDGLHVVSFLFIFFKLFFEWESNETTFI